MLAPLLLFRLAPTQLALQRICGVNAAFAARPRGWHAGSCPQQGSTADEKAEKIFEKGTKRMMESDDGRAELREGTFDLDKTAKRVLQEGKQALEQEGDGETAGHAKEAACKVEVQETTEVAQQVKERVIGTLWEPS